MMDDLSDTAEECRRLLARLDGTPSWDEINRIHHELAPIVGRLQAAVAAAERARGDVQSVRDARAALDTLKATQRRVGLDIRLSSPAALALGLEHAIHSALEVIAQLAVEDRI